MTSTALIIGASRTLGRALAAEDSASAGALLRRPVRR
jgi:hypothetical protein